MQYTTLFTLLTLLATPLTASAREPINQRRHMAQHAKHIRNTEAVTANLYRKAELAASNPRALDEKPIRKVMKRGATGCRVRGTNVTLTSTSPASTSAVSSVVGTGTGTTTVAAIQTAGNTVASSAAVTAATTSAGDDDSNDWNGGGGAATSPAWTPAASSAAPAATSAASTGHSAPVSGTPSGIKAGGAGSDTLAAYGSHTSWWFNYGSVADGSGSQLYIPMLWGNGAQGSQDQSRLASFEAMTSAPSYVFGFYEPDCLAPMSSDIDPGVAAALWLTTIAPWRNQGTSLISPGMCKQKDETWLQPFLAAIGGKDNIWDYTQIHTNKNTLKGVQDDVDYYWNTYGKPVWVNEFACVDDVNGFVACTDQGQINQFINDVVTYFEGDSRVVAYAMSEGEGLGNVWPPWQNGALTESGQTYLNAISQYH